MKKRTIFETTLVRRVAKKADFLRYITYEMNLEQLRKKRITRLGLLISPAYLSTVRGLTGIRSSTWTAYRF